MFQTILVYLYWHGWVFDIPELGIFKEPFVGPTEMLWEILSNGKKEIKVTVSDYPLEKEVKATLRFIQEVDREKYNIPTTGHLQNFGAYYLMEAMSMLVWLPPDFPLINTLPYKIYIYVEENKQ